MLVIVVHERYSLVGQLVAFLFWKFALCLLVPLKLVFRDEIFMSVQFGVSEPCVLSTMISSAIGTHLPHLGEGGLGNKEYTLCFFEFLGQF